jgi:YbbR domain-containing protein
VTISIPFELSPPDRLVLVNDPPETLQVHLRGPRTLVTSLSPSEVELAKLGGKLAEGENILSIPPSAIRVPRGIDVLAVDPQRVRIVLEGMVERAVEVRPHLEGSLPDGFVLRGAIPTPARVTVAGPRSQVRRLSTISTTPISLDGHTASFTTKVALESAGSQIRVSESPSISVLVDIAARRS